MTALSRISSSRTPSRSPSTIGSLFTTRGLCDWSRLDKCIIAESLTEGWYREGGTAEAITRIVVNAQAPVKRPTFPGLTEGFQQRSAVKQVNVTGALKLPKCGKEWLFTTLSGVPSSRQLSKVVLGCVIDRQQETRGLFRMESFYGDRPSLWHQARSPTVDSTAN